MKKFLSIIFSITLLMSMSVTVFAEDQVVSVSIPDYEYTMTIPADCSIEYKNTDFQSIGTVKFTSTDWDTFVDGHKAAKLVASSNGKFTNENGHEIFYEFGQYDANENRIVGIDFTCQFDRTETFVIKVSDWSRAEPGTTYTTTITYTASLMDTWW